MMGSGFGGGAIGSAGFKNRRVAMVIGLILWLHLAGAVRQYQVLYMTSMVMGD
jgi:hypothetical protein